MKYFLGSILCLALLSALRCAADATPADASITIDASKIEGPVNRLVFGENLEGNTGAIHGIPFKKWMDLPITTGMGLWDPKANRVVPTVADEVRSLNAGSLRFPGGCLSHLWDWRESIGPVAERGKGDPYVLPGDWTFGLDEYLQACRELNAEPVITTPDYLLPADQMPPLLAGLVEYLNAPATPDHPWAMKRAAFGHPTPYGVKYFELSNETWHGNHGVRPWRQYSPEAYAAYAVASARAMRAVDPTIKLGVVVWNENDTDWTRTVLKLAGPAADFVVMHIYLPTFNEIMSLPATNDNLMRGCMAVGQQTQFKLDEIRKQIREETGRDLPLAITEYGSGLERDQPSFALSYGAALVGADMLRVFLEPKNNVLFANQWDLISTSRGMLSNYHLPPSPVPERPAYYLFRLWGSHFGTQLVDDQTQGPDATYLSDNPAMYSAKGTDILPARLLQTIPLGDDLDFSKLPPNVSGEKGPDGIFVLNFSDFTGYAVKPLGPLPITHRDAGQETYYRLCYDGHLVTDGARPVALNLVPSDEAGKEAPNMAQAFAGAIDPDWRSFSRYYLPSLPGACALYARFESNTSFSGRLEIKNLKIEEYAAPVLPAYPLVTSSASLSADGKTLYLIVFNKARSGTIRTDIATNGFAPASAKLWQVTSPQPDALTAMIGVNDTAAGNAVSVTGGKIALDLPAHSMSALEITAR